MVVHASKIYSVLLSNRDRIGGITRFGLFFTLARISRKVSEDGKTGMLT